MSATIIAIYNAKGGEAKTTLSVNLGAVAARAAQHRVCTRNLRTLLVEFDAQGNSSSGLGVERDPARTIGAVLAGQIATEDAIRPTYLLDEGTGGKLDILSADLDLADIEAKMETDAYAIERLALALENVREEYDLILVDCHPGLGWFFRIAMRAADAYVIPMRLERFSFDGLKNCMDQMELHRPRYGLDPALLGIALLGVDYRLQRHTSLEADVRDNYGSCVFATVVRQNEPVAAAAFEGRAVVDFRPACRGSEGFREVMREMLQRAGRRGLFERSLVEPRAGAA